MHRSPSKAIWICVLTLALPLITSAATSTLLRVTGDRDYPPYSYLENGIPTGFDVEVIQAIAREMNLNIQIDLQAWSGARASLEDGGADIIAGMVRIPSREDRYRFTSPVKQQAFDIFVKKDSHLRTQFDAHDAPLVVQRAGVMHDLIRKKGQFRNITPVTDAPEGLKLLMDGAYEGALLNKYQTYYLIEENGYRGLRSLNADLPTLPYCLAVHKDDERLAGVLDEGLRIIRLNGRLDAISDKWLAHERDRHITIIRNGLLATLALFAVLVAVILLLRAAVQRRTRELRTVIDLNPYLLFARDRQGRYVLCNESAAASMSRNPQDIIGKKHLTLFPEEREKHLKYLEEDKQVFATGEPLYIAETRYRDPHGDERILEVTKIPFQWKDGEVMSVLCAAADITSLKNAEEAARQSRERLLAILDSITDAVIAVDTSGRIALINHVAESTLDLSEKAVVNMMFHDVVSLTSPDGAPFRITQLIQTQPSTDAGEDSTARVILHLPKGTKRDIAMHWAPIQRENNVTGMVFVLRDITDELQITERLYRNQRMESIGRLAGGIAHDFNNLLTGIVGYSELLSSILTENRECREHLQGIFDASERARDLVQQLLTFSRRHPKENRLVDINTAIGHVTSLLQHTVDRKIEVVEELADRPAHVMGDRSQIQNAILNLGINARDAMPYGGMLTLSSRCRTVHEGDLQSFTSHVAPGEFVEVTVTDTGIGMTEETARHIFEPFFTTKEKSGGSGLGLAAVYGTVNDHGGYIEVNSVPGKGTAIRFGLPLVVADALPARNDGVTQREHTGTGLILLVDDEPYIIKTLEAILAGLGYRTVSAPDGTTAVKLFAEHADTIDLVILDMIMPDIDGKETFTRIKAIKPDVRAIMSSGYLPEQNISDLTELGILGMLQKPFRKQELAAKIREVLQPGAHG